jgi:hypothetical protein
MTKNEKNKQIAILLGFKPYGYTVNGKLNGSFGWTYPDEFKSQQCCVPETSIPDFINIFKALATDEKLYMSNKLKRDYNTKPNIEDVKINKD